jgi:hypothetical protein
MIRKKAKMEFFAFLMLLCTLRSENLFAACVLSYRYLRTGLNLCLNASRMKAGSWGSAM